MPAPRWAHTRLGHVGGHECLQHDHQRSHQGLHRSIPPLPRRTRCYCAAASSPPRSLSLRNSTIVSVFHWSTRTDSLRPAPAPLPRSVSRGDAPHLSSQGRGGGGGKDAAQNTRPRRSLKLPCAAPYTPRDLLAPVRDLERREVGRVLLYKLLQVRVASQPVLTHLSRGEAWVGRRKGRIRGAEETRQQAGLREAALDPSGTRLCLAPKF